MQFRGLIHLLYLVYCSLVVLEFAKFANQFTFLYAEMKNWQPEERNTVSGKHSNEHASLSGQVMFENYVFQLLCVQKVLKEACTTSRRNNAFLGPGSSNAVSHQI